MRCGSTLRPCALELLAIEDEAERSVALAELPDEVREALGTLSDIESAIERELRARLGDNDGDCDLYVCDVGADSDWAVFNSYVDPPGMGYFRVGVSVDDTGAVTFTSDPQAVARVTTYEPVEAPAAPSLTAEMARADKVLNTVYRSLMAIEDMEARESEFQDYDEPTQEALLALYESYKAEADERAANAVVPPTVFDRDRLAIRWKAGTSGQHTGGGQTAQGVNVPAQHKVGDAVTAPHASGAAVPSKVTAVNGNKVTVQHQDGTKSTHPAHVVTPAIGAPAGSNYPNANKGPYG